MLRTREGVAILKELRRRTASRNETRETRKSLQGSIEFGSLVDGRRRQTLESVR